jgi:prophage maintenance system killer protein
MCGRSWRSLPPGSRDIGRPELGSAWTTEYDHPALTTLLARLQWQLAEPVDFTRTDTESTAAKVRLLSAAFQTFQGADPHPSPFDKAAMLLRGITQGYPFTDANKRTGFLVAIYYLDRVGFVLRPNLSPAEIVSFCRRVSAGDVRDLQIIAATLKAWTQQEAAETL